MNRLCMSCCIVSVLLVAGLAFSQGSAAPTITFHVPVQCQSLHQNVTEALVAVNCMNEKNEKIGSQVRSAVMVPDANGNINQTATIVVNADPTAKTYMVTLALKFPGVSDFGVPGESNSHIELVPKPGTTFEPMVQGNITW